MGVRVVEWKGAFWLRVNHRGHRKSKKVGEGKLGKRAAEAAAVQLQARIAQGDLSWFEGPEPLAPVVPVPTFAALAEEWLARYPQARGLRPGTVSNYRTQAERHLVPYFGAARVSEITPATVESFIVAKLGPGGSARFADRPLGRKSVRIGLVTLRLVLQRAVEQGHIATNPVPPLSRFTRGDKQQADPDPFTVAERRAIIEVAQRLNPDFAALLRVWIQTGMRAGEVCGLQQHDLDLNAGAAVVRRTFSAGRLGPTKTGQTRTVSLLHAMLEETSEWQPGRTPGAWAAVEGIRRLRVRSLNPDAFVFTVGDGPILNYWLNREWRRVLSTAGVRYRVPEQLRHSFASEMLSRGANLLYVQKQGGWQSASVLLRVYARWLPSGLEPPTRQPNATTGATEFAYEAAAGR